MANRGVNIEENNLFFGFPDEKTDLSTVYEGTDGF